MGVERTTQLTFTFSRDIDGLSAEDITLDAGSTGAEKGDLVPAGTGIYTLGLNGVAAAGPVTAGIADSYNITPASRTVQIHYPTPIQAAFSNLTANGVANTTTTTELYLAFDKDIAGLGLGDIALAGGSTGATKSSFDRTGPGAYTLGISGVTAAGSVTVTVSKAGYIISDPAWTVQVHYSAASEEIQAAFSSLIANGSATTTSTTELYLAFDKDIDGLGLGDIALAAGSTGAAKSSVTKTSTGHYTLGISGVAATGSVTVTVSKSGYNITPASQTVQVYAATVTQATFSGLTANGSSTATTTELYLTFDKDITGLGSGDITLSGLAGVTKGSVTKTSTGKYTLGISGVTATGSVTVAVSKTGYVISNPTRSVQVYAVTQATFSGLTANGSSTATTTELYLTFDKDITSLGSGDITLSGLAGVTKGSVTKTNTGKYTLGISGVTASGSVTVAVSKSGYVISNPTRSVQVYYVSSSSGGTSYYVSASGNDTWDGQTATTPFKTLAKGYSSAMASSTRKRIVVLTNLSGEKITLDATSMPNKSATVTIEGNGSGIVIRRTSGTSDSVMEITGGGKVTFKQITINGKYASDVYHRAITVSGSGTEVTLDNGTAITGSIGTTGSTSGTAQGAGILVKSNGKLVLKAGSTVTNCVINSMNTEGNSGGGGIGVIGGGKLVMDGGTISGSTAYDGGGVMVSGSSSSFTMNNGTISGNTAGANGGGVHVRGASFSMTGGTISGNKAEKWRNINGPNGTGGGVYLYWGASFAMTGGTIYGSGSVTSSTLRNTVASSGAAFSNDANHSGTSPFSVKTVNTTIENGVILSQ
jgi:hypothetical protein